MIFFRFLMFGISLPFFIYSEQFIEMDSIQFDVEKVGFWRVSDFNFTAIDFGVKVKITVIE
jgi:hypothetical protein